MQPGNKITKAAEKERIRRLFTTSSSISCIRHRMDMDSEQINQKIRSRRTHRKSRLGCGNCKKRRVKVGLTDIFLNFDKTNMDHSATKKSQVVTTA